MVKVGLGVQARGGVGWGRMRAVDQRAGCYGVGRGKFGHVADAIGEGDGGGPASEQGPEPLRRLASRVVVVEG